MINKLNKLQGIYSISKRLQPFDMSIIKIESINAFLVTNKSMNKLKQTAGEERNQRGRRGHRGTLVPYKIISEV